MFYSGANLWIWHYGINSAFLCPSNERF